MSNISIEIDAKTILDGLFSTTDGVYEVANRLQTVALPWAPNGSVPPDYERKLGTGEVVGLVSPSLGGFQWPHRPWEHGWGVKVSVPKCGTGFTHIETVDTTGAESEADLRDLAAKARDRAMERADAFLRKEYPGLTLLGK